MNKFVNKVQRQHVEARTENNMKALASTTDACVDLFFHIGASRGKDIRPMFEKAFAESPEHACRIALWSRDIRGGAGERQLFRDLLLHLEKYEPYILLHTNFLERVPVVGRWDDLLVLQTPQVRAKVNRLIATALVQKNGLCAKWMPRKGARAALLRTELGMTPKFYRKTLVNLTNVVESQMCSKEWTEINFEHVPSLAMSRYAKAFGRNALEHYLAFKQKLQTGEAKVNAGAVYPYNVIQTLGADEVLANEMWKALPDYMDDQNVLPLVDVSGSMTCPAGGSPSVSCLDVALSLGLYCADKNKGAFKDTFLTFSSRPQLLHLKGKLSVKMNQMCRSQWEMNTNLHAAMEKILSHAVDNNVPQKDMPTALLIMSDMQFDQCTRFDDSAYEMIARKFKASGYELPAIVFWNLNSYGSNVPVDFKKKGCALVSGFSPAIMKSVLAADFDKMTPASIMLQTIMNDRYIYSEEV